MHQLGYLHSSTYDQPITVDQTSRFQHTYVLGQTGTGKSSWATDSFLQDVHAGFGACYFDFHGQDAAWLLDQIPPERINDVVYLNPLDVNGVIGYNVLDGINPADYANFTDEIVSSLRHINSASWGARMDDILINAIRPLFDLPDESKGTILGAVRMLNDPFYRKWVVNRCSEKTVRDFWFMEFANWSKGEQGHNVNSSLNKIRRFQSMPVLQRVLGQQKSGVNFAKAIQDGQILIFDFNRWQMGEKNANTLASLVLSRLIYEASHWLMLQVDGAISEDLVKPFHVYIDEFHSVTSLSMVEALSGIRKFRVGFTLCHQYTGQLSQEILDAIKGNVGTKIVFRVGGDDAKQLQSTLGVIEPKHLTEQADYCFFVSSKSENSVSTRRGHTLPSRPTHYGHANAIRNRMTAKYSAPISQIDATYERWQNSRHYGGDVGRPTVKKKQERGGEKPTGTGFKSLSQIMLN
jgi:hypothetical protein